jgi:methyl-accepting chemotaxis protein-1 (serine sensor receptor)
MVSTEFEARRRSVFSWGALAKLGLTAAFCAWFYMIWTSIDELEGRLKATTDPYAVAHNLQADYKMEVQEWKNLLLRSTDRASLDKNWQAYEQQYLKVAAAAEAGMRQTDVRAVNVKLQSFVDAHKENHEQYRKDTEVFARSGFDPRKADTEVKGIDRPLLVLLEAADEAMQHEKELIDGRMIAKVRNQIEQSLMALIVMVLVVVWRARF